MRACVRITLLTPSASAMRTLLANCESFGDQFGLQFNPLKTQFIRFHLGGSSDSNPVSHFLWDCTSTIQTVLHLGHKLSSNLSDDDDILLKSRHLSRATNSLFSTFHFSFHPSYLSLFLLLSFSLRRCFVETLFSCTKRSGGYF